MKCFITGGTGFIGSRTTKRLAQAGHEIKCLVRNAGNAGHLKDLGASLISGSLGDRRVLLEGMRGSDAVVNIAGAYSFWLPRKQTYTEVNIEGARNVMECALEAGISKIVHVSTVAVYGRPADRPFRESSAPGPVRFSEYARTKYEGDLIAWELHESRGLPVVMVYPGAVLGPGDPKTTGEYIRNIINGRMPATVFNDSFFPFVHVQDVAEVIARAAEKEGNIGEKYMVVAENLTFGQINHMVGEISGVPLPRLAMPGWLAMVTASLLTFAADIGNKPPMWGMAVDQMRTMKEGAQVDGSKAERELGIAYTPIRAALEDEISSCRR